MAHKVYMLGENPGSLLLVEGKYVINGHWYLRRKRDGRLVTPDKEEIEATFVMDAPCEGDYNKVLNEAQRLMGA